MENENIDANKISFESEVENSGWNKAINCKWRGKIAISAQNLPYCLCLYFLQPLLQYLSTIH